MNSSRLGGMFRNYLELVQWAVSPLEVEDLCWGWSWLGRIVGASDGCGGSRIRGRGCGRGGRKRRRRQSQGGCDCVQIVACPH